MCEMKELEALEQEYEGIKEFESLLSSSMEENEGFLYENYFSKVPANFWDKYRAEVTAKELKDPRLLKMEKLIEKLF